MLNQTQASYFKETRNINTEWWVGRGQLLFFFSWSQQKTK